MNHEQRQVLITTSLSHGMIHVCELAVPALLILIQPDFAIGDYSSGRIVAIYGLLFGLGALPAGFLVDHLGSKRLLLACLWGSAASMIGMALSPSVAIFTICAAFMGLFLSIYHPAGTSLITHSIPLSGKVFAIHGMAGNLGVAGASVIAGTLGQVFGWRWAVGLLALIGFGLGVRVLTLPAPSVHEVRSRTGRGDPAAFIWLLVAAAFLGMIYRGVTTFLPKFFATHFTEGESLGAAWGGLLATVALMAGLVGMYAAGRMIDAGARPSRVFLLGAVVQGPFLLALGYVAGPALLPMAMGVAFFHFFTQPPGNHMVAEFTPAGLRGLGYGIYFFLAFGAGSVGAGFGGWVSERFSPAQTFPALGTLLVPAVVAALALWFLTRNRSASLRGAR